MVQKLHIRVVVSFNTINPDADGGLARWNETHNLCVTVAREGLYIVLPTVIAPSSITALSHSI